MGADRTTLSQLLEKAKGYKPTKEEAFEQRVSFAYGNLPEENTLTKDQVRQIARETYGG